MFNHEAETLTEVIGIDKEDMDHYFDEIVWSTYDRIRMDKDLSKAELAQVIVHLVGVYEMYDEVVIPILGAIYGYQTEEFKQITELNVSYQIEAIVEYCDDQISKYLGGLYTMVLIKDADESK